MIARDRPAAFSDALGAWRAFLWPALGVGLVVGGASVVLGYNLAVGLASLEPLGWALGTLAAWALLGTWAVALFFWPLLVDPLRAGEPVLARLRLAGSLLLLRPLQTGLLLILLALILFLSVIMFAALVTITIAFMALVMARYVLPLADRLEGRPTLPVVPRA